MESGRLQLGTTVVDSFESLVGATSQTAQNIYLVSPSAGDALETVKWVFQISDRALGLAASVEKVSEHVQGSFTFSPVPPFDKVGEVYCVFRLCCSLSSALGV